MTEPLSPEREQEIRESIPTVYGPPWTVHPDWEDGTWRVMYATDHPLAGLVAVVPDYGSHLAEFIATARAAVPELLAEIERLRGELAEARAAALLEAAEVGESLRQFEPALGARKAAQISENVGILRVTERLRSLADETQPSHRTGEGPGCSAALLPFGRKPADPCVVKGKHREHMTAEGRRWTIVDEQDGGD